MAACVSNFLVTDNFDVVMATIDANILEKDTELLSEVNSVVENLPSAKKSRHPYYHICSKIFLLKSGLSRDVKSKHPENLPPNEKCSLLKCSCILFC